jgi:Flp pilus assembly protein TadD
LLAALIAAIYGPALDVPFVFDDIYTIRHNDSIISLWPLLGTAEHRGPLYPAPQLPTAARPLVNLSFAVNYYFGGFEPVGYHVVNVMIHFLSSLLVWAIVRRTLQLDFFEGRFAMAAPWLALAVAVLWAVHPLQTESVIYATQRTELMFAFFYLATLYCSMRYWEYLPLPLGEGRGEGALEKQFSSRGIWLTLAVIACLAGMASKEVMVSAPLMVLLFERTFVAGSLTAALRRSWPLYVGLASTWLLLIGLLLGRPHSESAGFHLGVDACSWWLTQARVFWLYLKLVVWPAPLLIHYEFPYLTTIGESWQFIVPTLLLGLVTLVLLWRNRPLGYLGTWIFAILSPTFVIPIITEIAAERRMYLPLIAIAVVFVVGGYLLTSELIRPFVDGPKFVRRLSQLSALASLLILAVALGVASANRLEAYDDETNLWREVLRVYPQDAIAQYNLGSQHLAAGRLEEAVEAFQIARAQKPDEVDVLNNLGLALLRLGRYEEGYTHLRHAVQMRPNSLNARLNLGLLLTRAGHHAESIEHFQAALALKPDEPNALNTMGLALILSDRCPEAVEVLERAVRLRPDSTEIHNRLANALARSGNVSAAIERYRQTLRLNPSDPEALYNLGLLLTASGDAEKAVAHFQEALRLQPEVAEFHSSFADLLRKLDRSQEAIDHYQTAVRLKPDYLPPYGNLVQMLAAADRSAEAIAIAVKGIEFGRATKQDGAAGDIEEWLMHYRRELQRAGETVAPDETSIQ